MAKYAVIEEDIYADICGNFTTSRFPINNIIKIVCGDHVACPYFIYVNEYPKCSLPYITSGYQRIRVKYVVEEKEYVPTPDVMSMLIK